MGTLARETRNHGRMQRIQGVGNSKLMEVYAAMVDRIGPGTRQGNRSSREKRKMLDDTLIMFIADNGGGCRRGNGSARRAFSTKIKIQTF